MSSASCGRLAALSFRSVAGFAESRLWLALICLLGLSLGSAASNSETSNAEGWLRLEKIGCKDDTTETLTGVAWPWICEMECGKRSECLAYSYNRETKRCFLKETPCDDREPESLDMSGIKAPPFSSVEVASVLWNFRESLDCFDDDCDIAEWNLLSDPCDWRGVDCQGSQANTIRRLDLSNCGLRGQLPSDFAKLKTLEEIDLNANYLYGKLQADWDLLELTSLDLSGNQLSGYLPWWWSSNIPGIIQLKLNNNRLEGPLPASWWNMKSLHTLDVSDNLLTGKLPKLWSAIGAKQLHLNDNELSGPLPPEWTEIECLNELNVCNNQLDTTAPGEWITWHVTKGIEVCVLPQRVEALPVPPSVVTADVCGSKAQPPPAVYSGYEGELVISGSPIQHPFIPCPDDFFRSLCREPCSQACRETENCNAFMINYQSCSLYSSVSSVYYDLCDECAVSVCTENCPAGTTPYYYGVTPWACTDEPVQRIPMTCSNPGSFCDYELECYLACKENDESCNFFFLTTNGDDVNVPYCDLYRFCSNTEFDSNEVFQGRSRLTEAEEEAYLIGLWKA